jgi:hypothetical protein
MKMRPAVAILVVAAAGLAVAAVRQEEHGPAQPGKFHELLKQFEGTWETKSEFQMAPEAAVMKSTGTEVSKFGVGGLFMISEVASEMGGMKFEAHSMMGYDVHKKKFTGSWVDNMSTAIWPFEGTADAAGKVFTLTMEGPNPANGELFKIKLVHEITGKDTRKLTLFMPGPDGKEMEMKIDYTRKK